MSSWELLEFAGWIGGQKLALLVDGGAFGIALAGDRDVSPQRRDENGSGDDACQSGGKKCVPW